MNATTLPKDLVGALVAIGWSQSEIAAELGLRRETVSRIAAGLQTPKRESFYKLLDLVERESARIRRLREHILKLTEGELA